MDWNQIENKWAAMARRIRNDLSEVTAIPELNARKGPKDRSSARLDINVAALAERNSKTTKSVRAKNPAE